jgi:protein-tyrosine phosphatase
MPGVSEPFRVCFVCLGNICRSPMAEAVFRDRVATAGLDGRVEVASAGTGGWHVGEGADRRARAALRERGYTDRHEVRQIRAGDVDRYDLLVALDSSNAADLLRLAASLPDPPEIRLLREFDSQGAAEGADLDDLDVPDPYDDGPAEFAHALNLIEAACDGLVEHVRSRLG